MAYRTSEETLQGLCAGMWCGWWDKPEPPVSRENRELGQQLQRVDLVGRLPLSTSGRHDGRMGTEEKRRRVRLRTPDVM
jgi:hypothetical protein